LGKKLRINGTPVTFFVDGERVVGALPLTTIEAKLASAVAPPKSNVVAPPAVAASAAAPAKK
jgi:thiol:disulfide interchange protein DsbC